VALFPAQGLAVSECDLCAQCASELEDPPCRKSTSTRALVKEITDAVVRNFNVGPEAVMVQIVESPKTSKAKGGVLFSDKMPG
jgi:4-oxalocrotonate tautomerase